MVVLLLTIHTVAVKALIGFYALRHLTNPSIYINIFVDIYPCKSLILYSHSIKTQGDNEQKLKIPGIYEILCSYFNSYFISLVINPHINRTILCSRLYFNPYKI